MVVRCVRWSDACNAHLCLMPDSTLYAICVHVQVAALFEHAQFEGHSVFEYQRSMLLPAAEAAQQMLAALPQLAPLRHAGAELMLYNMQVCPELNPLIGAAEGWRAVGLRHPTRAEDGVNVAVGPLRTLHMGAPHGQTINWVGPCFYSAEQVILDAYEPMPHPIHYIPYNWKTIHVRGRINACIEIVNNEVYIMGYTLVNDVVHWYVDHLVVEMKTDYTQVRKAHQRPLKHTALCSSASAFTLALCTLGVCYWVLSSWPACLPRL